MPSSQLCPGLSYALNPGSIQLRSLRIGLIENRKGLLLAGFCLHFTVGKYEVQALDFAVDFLER